MKVIVIGTVEFSLAMLETIHSQNVELVGVITGQNSGINDDYCDLSIFCEENAIACHKTSNINGGETLAWVNSKSADVIFCLGWSWLIKKELLNVTPLGIIGYHPTELPKNRGRHPLIWALIMGLNKTASSFFFMDEGTDDGDILSQELILISDDDDASSLYKKMKEVANEQIKDILFDLKTGNFSRKKQDHSLANVWRKRGKKDGEVDWRMSARSIYNLIRALSHPYAGAHFVYKDKEYKVWSSEIVDIEHIDNLEPGKVIAIENGHLTVKCGEGCITLLDIDNLTGLSWIGDYLE